MKTQGIRGSPFVAPIEKEARGACVVRDLTAVMTKITSSTVLTWRTTTTGVETLAKITKTPVHMAAMAAPSYRHQHVRSKQHRR